MLCQLCMSPKASELPQWDPNYYKKKGQRSQFSPNPYSGKVEAASPKQGLGLRGSIDSQIEELKSPLGNIIGKGLSNFKTFFSDMKMPWKKEGVTPTSSHQKRGVSHDQSSYGGTTTAESSSCKSHQVSMSWDCMICTFKNDNRVEQ